MSRYTTEVRFICESKIALENSSSADNVDEVIARAWNKIFTDNAPFFDESYRGVLCQKILKHYYLREICCETFGVWKLWMNERLEMIMPYYNQLYKSTLIKFDPLNDVNLSRKQERTIGDSEERKEETSDTYNDTKKVTGTNTIKETGTGKTETSASTDETKKDLYSDTPQGAITALENGTYLTNARIVTDSATSSNNESTDTTRSTNTDYTENEIANNTKNGTNKVIGTKNTTEDYLETLVGKQGGGTYSKMLIEFRNTFLNIDMMVVNEFKDLFFGLW